MLRHSFLLVFFLSLSSSSLRAQLICSGVLLDSTNKQPLEFVNIGIPSKGIGTVSDEKGAFRFTVPDSLKDLNVRISLIGYRSITVPAKDLANSATLMLSPQSTNLAEVQVNPKKIKIKVLGNETLTQFVSAGFTSNALGAEMGIKLNIKHPDTYLRKLSFQINKNSLNKLPVFRLNIYHLGKDGLPAENILKQNIILEPTNVPGLVELDLKPYLIFVSEDVVISLEWIKDLGDSKGLYFSSKMIGSATYFRSTSQDQWHKVGPVGVGLFVEVGY